ncbi:MAG: hypothetical protein FWF81_00690 [Defluviitaleaceae bacterium]|nr:hypothetical protein [Defluviitaleaceae bacterium]
MNVQINTQLNTGNGMREATRSGSNPIGDRFNRNANFGGLTNAVKIDSSLREIMDMRRHFLHQLNSDAESKTFEQLHAEILENFSGEERDKRVAALNAARQISEKREAAPFNPIEAFSNFEERTARLEQHLDTHWENLRNSHWGNGFGLPSGIRHYLDPRTCQITQNGFGNGLILVFGGMLRNEMMSNGIEGGLALFEKIWTDLVENFTGSEEELQARLDALEMGFLRAADQFAHMVATSQMAQSPHYTPDDGSNTLTPRQVAANSRLQREANNLIDHIGGMFRAALAFFNATGSFAGFFDTAEANQSGMPSMRDVDTLARQTFQMA